MEHMEHITYLAEFADYVTGAADLPSLVEAIKEHGTEGDYLDIYVQQDDQDDTEGASETIPIGGGIVIGHTQCYYMQEGIFLQEIESNGAGIGLCEKLNNLVKQQAQAEKGLSTMEYNAQIAARLQQTRCSKGLSQSEAGTRVNLSGEDIGRIETATLTPTAEQFIKLCFLYDVQVREVMAGPYPYNTPEQWLQAYCNGDITEGLLSYGLHVDRVTAREMVQEYREKAQAQA